MQFFLQLSFLFVCLTTISLSFPIEDPLTKPMIPLNPIEGHFTRSFTNEFELFSSTKLTPSVNETTSTTKPMEKKEILPEDQSEMTSTTEEIQKVEETKRNFDEIEPVEVESTSTESPVEETTTVQRPLMTKKEKPMKFVSRSDDDDEEEKPKKKLVEKTKSKVDESVESEEELTTSSGLVAEFDPNVFDSISTPAGTQLKFDENHQSIERLTTEETSTNVVQEEKEKEKEKELNETKLNQVQNSTVAEEEKSDH